MRSVGVWPHVLSRDWRPNFMLVNETLSQVVLVVQLVSRHSCVADRLPVVVRFPAGPRVRLKTVDPPKGNGLGTKKMLVKETLEYVGWGEAITLWSKRVCQWEERRCLRQLAVGQFPSVGWCCTRWRFFLRTCWLLWTLVMRFYRWTSSANQGREYVILKNLPGQRLGARSWCWYFRNYLEKFQYEFCDVQPCLSRTRDSVILIHGWHPLHWQNSLRNSFYQFVKSVSLSNGVHCKSLAAQSRSWRRRSLWLYSRWPHGSSWYTSSQGGWSFWEPFWLIPCDASQSNLRTYQLNWLRSFRKLWVCASTWVGIVLTSFFLSRKSQARCHVRFLWTIDQMVQFTGFSSRVKPSFFRWLVDERQSASGLMFGKRGAEQPQNPEGYQAIRNPGENERSHQS